MYEAFLFDMDGTLIRLKLDFKKMRRDLEKIIGNMEGKILESISKIENEKIKKQALEYLCNQEKKAANKSKIMTGSKECLRYLKEKNIKIGVITRNNRESTIISAKKTKILDYIDIIISRDDVEKVKPDSMHIIKILKKLNTDSKKSVVIGDHHFEIEAGKKLGCLTVGLLSGSGTKETLKNADLLFDSIKEFYEEWVKVEI